MSRPSRTMKMFSPVHSLTRAIRGEQDRLVVSPLIASTLAREELTYMPVLLARRRDRVGVVARHELIFTETPLATPSSPK